ncbi:hypothetical protein E0I56_005665 [Escherichia coli]|nr:hypothetical protein [Escherichia coli]
MIGSSKDSSTQVAIINFVILCGVDIHHQIRESMKPSAHFVHPALNVPVAA